MDKVQLRRELKVRLGGLSEAEKIEQSKKACRILIASEEYRRASVVMVYLSLPHEVDTTPIILDAWQSEKTVAVPKVSWQQRHMIPVEITTLETGLTSEASGLRNPVTGVPVPLEDIDLVVTPGLAFDKHGNRLGRGGAYYDKFFSSKLLEAKRVGIAFSQQIVESVPVEDHDQSVDKIITDEGIIDSTNF